LKYNFQIDMTTDNTLSLLLRRIKPNSRVLEMGPATGYMTRYMSEILGCKVYCVEIDKEAAKIAELYSEKMIVGNLDDLEWGNELEKGSFDHIIFADVLEHLVDPWKVLTYATAFLKKNGTTLISVPNIAHNAILIGLYNDTFRYQSRGLLDETHIRFFTSKGFLELLGRANLAPIEWLGTIATPDYTELGVDYNEVPYSFGKALKRRENGNVYQYIAVSKRLEDITDLSEICNNFILEDPAVQSDHIQIFLGKKQRQYHEDESIKLPLSLDSSTNVYTALIDSDDLETLRIDLGSQPAHISLNYIKLYTMHLGEEKCVYSWNVSEGFGCVIFGEGLVHLQNEKSFDLICCLDDPQIIVDIDSLGIVGSNLKLELEISIDQDNLQKSLGNLYHLYITEKNKIKELQEQINLLNDEATIKILQLNSLDKVNQDLTQINKDLLTEIDEISRENNELKNLIKLKDEMNNCLEDKNHQFENELIEKDNMIVGLKNQLLESENVISKRDHIIQEKERVIFQKQTELLNIYNSDGWRLLLGYYRMRDRLLPVNSRMRKSLKKVKGFRRLVRKSQQHIKLYGFKSFAKKVNVYLNSRKKKTQKQLKIIQAPKLGINRLLESMVEPLDISISVIIPTKNAGDDFEPLVKMLLKQRGFNRVEIIVVDSGSSDQTLEIASRFSCNIVRIKPEQFSHSYSRNLGAENATGDYLLFTTQDALPPTDTWLYELATALVQNKAAAVSCAETPREDADLFYRVICWNHYRFLEVNGTDRILTKPNIEDHINLRKNGQLSDIANLISKELFFKYKYRYNYAEDLDLGIRLIKDGYSLVFLGTTRIIHSHLRPAYYFMKRGYVDNLFLSNIFNDFVIPKLDFNNLKRDILLTYYILTEIINGINCESTNGLIEYVNKKIEVALTEDHSIKNEEIFDESDYADDQILAFIKNIYQQSGKPEGKYDGILIHALSGMLNITFEYMVNTYENIDRYVIEDFKLCLFKEFSFLTGAHLAYCYLNLTNEEVNPLLMSINEELSKGV